VREIRVSIAVEVRSQAIECFAYMWCFQVDNLALGRHVFHAWKDRRKANLSSELSDIPVKHFLPSSNGRKENASKW
jgi:hypothetical protein